MLVPLLLARACMEIDHIIGQRSQRSSEQDVYRAQRKKLRNKENKVRRKIELSLFLIDPLVKIRHVRMLTVLNRRSQHSAKLPADESEPVSVFRKHVIPHSLIYRPCMGLLTSRRIVFVKIWSRNNRRRCGHRVHSRVWKPL